MESALYLQGGQINRFAQECSDKINSSPSRQAALKTIADYASPHLETYLALTLRNPDEISMHFLDLLDQIIFETTENIQSDDPVHEYMIEDLYSRLCIYLDIFGGRETYAGNFNKRNITFDDTIIIRQCRMEELVPQLVEEYNEQPILQKPILKALFNFDSEILLNLYYNITKDGNSIEEKILALIGLKRFISKFNFDNLHTAGNEEYTRLVEYAQSFRCHDVAANSLPGDTHSLLFSLNFIECNAGEILDPPVFAWVLRALRQFLKPVFNGRISADIHKSANNIILLAKPEALGAMIKDKELAAALVQVLDFFPGEFSYKLDKKISLIKNDFANAVKRFDLSEKLKLDGPTSFIMKHILWESGSRL